MAALDSRRIPPPRRGRPTPTAMIRGSDPELSQDFSAASGHVPVMGDRGVQGRRPGPRTRDPLGVAPPCASPSMLDAKGNENRGEAGSRPPGGGKRWVGIPTPILR